MLRLKPAVLALAILLASAPVWAQATSPAGENRQFVQTVQEMLAKTGYMAPSEADGRLGAKTRDAIRRFQKDSGVKEDGRLTPELFERLAKKARD
ncbi:MAG: peptidoglycan-binding protein [Alphaproteobacteria bacterium]|nr:peptidoglycan-binding protein [Alphaproteobacteria bacterium]